MTSSSPGNAIVAPYRNISAHMNQADFDRFLDGIEMAIDAHVAKLQENLDSAVGGQRIALERLQAAEQLAAERLEGLLAAAAFSTVLAKQLRLEHETR